MIPDAELPNAGVRKMSFRLIFVMDVLDGMVVHAQRGDRSRYQPIELFSSIVNSSDPLPVVDEIKPAEVYIADLNRLMNTGDNCKILRELSTRKGEMRIMLDYGIRELEDLKEVGEAKLADTFVLGTETTSMDLIEEATRSNICDDLCLSVSVDLLDKGVVTSDKRLQIDPLVLIETLNQYPITDVIVLELDRVGTKRGIDFDFLARAVDISEHHILCGGGVRSCQDIDAMEKIGVNGALVATALHDEAIPLSVFR